jgi:hypothetical protein
VNHRLQESERSNGDVGEQRCGFWYAQLYNAACRIAPFK